MSLKFLKVTGRGAAGTGERQERARRAVPLRDFRHMGEYREAFLRLGLEVRNVPLSLATFPPLRIVAAESA
jgi:hypothetical protein